jgi:hypothetical protein
MGVDEVEAFLTYLAVQEKVSASTQNQAFNALLFLWGKSREPRSQRKRSPTPAKATPKV